MKTSHTKIFSFCMIVLAAHALYGQPRESFDIASFISPKGWKKENNNTAVSYVVTNNISREWCRLTVFKSTGSSGNATTDFDHEWETLVTKQYQGTTKPLSETSTEDGWTAQSGVSKFIFQGNECFVLLNTISGYGKELSVMVTMNGQEFMGDVERFLSSIDLQKPSPDSFQEIQTKENTLVQMPSASPAGSTGISKSVTNFDDGWTARALDDYVLVTKENTKFYIHYGVSIPANSSSGERPTTQANWDRFIAPRYDITNLWLNPDVGSWGGSFNYYAEGSGTERSTGQPVFIGFRTIIEGNAYFCVEAVSPTKEEYLKHFPNLNMLKTMRNSNRFAITREDVIGDWSSSSSSALQYYNVYTGQSAGMLGTQSDESFSFKANGEYQAKISGIMGTLGGAQTYYDGNYNGQFTAYDWEMTLTKYGKVNQTFTCHFEAVKGGRILHIAKKDAPGVAYTLVKVK
jgi:hypothetical protein